MSSTPALQVQVQASMAALLNLLTRLSPLTRAGLVAGAAFVAHTLHAWLRLRHVPGPRWHALSALGFTITHLRGTPHADIMHWSLRHGPLVRVGPNTTLTSDFRTMQRLSSAKSRYRKSGWYASFRFIKGQDHSFSMVDERGHTAIRNKIVGGYRGGQAMEEAVDRQVRRLVDLVAGHFVNELDTVAPGNPPKIKTMDIALITHLFALDVVGDLTYGKAFGFLDRGEDLFSFLQWNDDFFSVAAVMSTVPSLAKVAKLWPLCELLPKKTDKLGLGRFISYSDAVIGARYDSAGNTGQKRHGNLIDTWIRMGVTKDEAVNQSLVQIVAGTDSVAVVMRMIILYTSSSPRVCARLLAEMDAAHAEPALSYPLTNAEARKLPYLQAVIREGMRIFPGTNALGIKVVPPEGDVVCGYKLPGGTGIGLDIWGAMRRENFWGPDAHVFRPERWLEAEAEGGARLADMIDCLEFQFGYGRYQCLGKWVVATELNKAIPELLRRFHFTAVNPLRPTIVKSAGFYIMHDFDVVVTARTES